MPDQAKINTKDQAQIKAPRKIENYSNQFFLGAMKQLPLLIISRIWDGQAGRYAHLLAPVYFT